MPRGRRQESRYDLHHIVLRGKDGLGLFLEERDCREFQYIIDSKLEEMPQVRMDSFYMGKNHFHAVVKAKQADITQFCSGVSVRYAWAYNQEHHRSGTIFAGRFLSEPVEERYEYEEIIEYLENHKRNQHWRINPRCQYGSWKEMLHQYPIILDVPADLHRQRVTILSRIAFQMMEQENIKTKEELIKSEKLWRQIQREAKGLFGYSRDYPQILNDFLQNRNTLASQFEKGYNKKQKSFVEATHIVPKQYRANLTEKQYQEIKVQSRE